MKSMPCQRCRASVLPTALVEFSSFDQFANHARVVAGLWDMLGGEEAGAKPGGLEASWSTATFPRHVFFHGTDAKATLRCAQFRLFCTRQFPSDR